MKYEDRIQPNNINAPVLFIGLGGIGSKIIKGVLNHCKNDNMSKMRFVVMDTDVNDLLKADSAGIVAIQTSSPKTVEEYLSLDADAKNNWFPENKMLDPKTVSEGAGQVRAISRLALNATIKQGEIMKLYKAIDDLFLKDGGEFKQSIRVVIASTSAGGTGSGIATEVAMLVRHYAKKTYPASAVMIRGFLVMPGVLDTVISTQSERESLRCNSYATIKEINAFMMKGSGFFDTVPELHRYKDLSISIPSAGAGEEKLSYLPFDFCFLMDKTDANIGNMLTLDDYIEYASQSIYEQNIGPMSTRSSSMEDNVLKLCITPSSLGRCRFGGIGASSLVYPYKEIRDYIALNWARNSIIGSSNKKLTKEDRIQLLKNSWLQYDYDFKQEAKDYEDNPTGEEPKLEVSYVNSMRKNKDDSSGNNFTSMLWKKYLTPKVLELVKTSGAEANENSERMKTTLDDINVEYNTQEVARAFLSSIIDEIIGHRLRGCFPGINADVDTSRIKSTKNGSTHTDKYEAIQRLYLYSKDERVGETAKNFARGVFGSKASIKNPELGEYMLEKYFCVKGKPMHPNAARYMLYELKTVINLVSDAFKKQSNIAEYEDSIIKNNNGDGSIEQFQVKNIKSLGKEESLADMCEACDTAELYSGAEHNKCEKLLDTYFNYVWNFLVASVGIEVCEVALASVDNLIKAYHEFYSSFETKVPTIERMQNDIITKIKEKSGDSIRYLFGKEGYLDVLSSMVAKPLDENDSELFASIFESLRSNSYLIGHRAVDPFAYVPKEDIFEDVIVDYFKKFVEENCAEINVKHIFEALKLEFEVSVAIKVNAAPEEKKKAVSKLESSENNMKDYIRDRITTCRNLASPGIKKRDDGELRAIDEVACCDLVEDGNGLIIKDYLPKLNKSDAVSRYEMRFFRAVYNITPVQLPKFCAPKYNEDSDEFSLLSKDEYVRADAGDYFNIYQRYMDSIGPDSKKTAVITPHCDTRWNAICIMPELDIEYQKRLMRKIHKAFIYGFIYDRITLNKVSDDDDDKIYKYFDCDERKIELVVSNNTRCDVLYEVLNSLYFDRQAVATLRNFVSESRLKSAEEGFKAFEDSEFYNTISELKHSKVVNCVNQKVNAEKMSLFEIVLMYCNSLPTQSKDTDEMITMLEAVKEIIYSEVKICTNNADILKQRVANALIEQYDLLVKNYTANKSFLRNGVFSDEVIESAYGVIYKYLKTNDLLKLKSALKKYVNE